MKPPSNDTCSSPYPEGIEKVVSSDSSLATDPRMCILIAVFKDSEEKSSLLLLSTSVPFSKPVVPPVTNCNIYITYPEPSWPSWISKVFLSSILYPYAGLPIDIVQDGNVTVLPRVNSCCVQVVT